MFSQSLTSDSITKLGILVSVFYIILELYTSCILSVYGILILGIAHYKSKKLMHVHFLVVETNMHVNGSHLRSSASTRKRDVITQLNAVRIIASSLHTIQHQWTIPSLLHLQLYLVMYSLHYLQSLRLNLLSCCYVSKQGDRDPAEDDWLRCYHTAS